MGMLIRLYLNQKHLLLTNKIGKNRIIFYADDDDNKLQLKYYRDDTKLRPFVLYQIAPYGTTCWNIAGVPALSNPPAWYLHFNKCFVPRLTHVQSPASAKSRGKSHFPRQRNIIELQEIPSAPGSQLVFSANLESSPSGQVGRPHKKTPPSRRPQPGVEY